MKSVFTALILLLFLLSVNTVYAANVTTEQVTNTSTVVKSYMETNHTLPSGVDVGENPVSRSQYLQLSTITVLNINNDSNATIHINSCNNLAYPSESSSSRNINKTEYLDIANRVNIFINNYGIAPNYTSTRTGTIRYESLIYIYSQIYPYAVFCLFFKQDIIFFTLFLSKHAASIGNLKILIIFFSLSYLTMG